MLLTNCYVYIISVMENLFENILLDKVQIAIREKLTNESIEYGLKF